MHYLTHIEDPERIDIKLYELAVIINIIRLLTIKLYVQSLLGWLFSFSLLWVLFTVLCWWCLAELSLAVWGETGVPSWCSLPPRPVNTNTQTLPRPVSLRHHWLPLVVSLSLSLSLSLSSEDATQNIKAAGVRCCRGQLPGVQDFTSPLLSSSQIKRIIAGCQYINYSSVCNCNCNCYS